MTTPTTGETVSERPNFAEVLAEHRIYGFNGIESACRCSMRKWRTEGEYRAHLAAVLNAEVDRWLADEGTREWVAAALDFCARPDEFVYQFQERQATAALAALATPTVPTTEEQRAPTPYDPDDRDEAEFLGIDFPTPPAVRGEGGEER